MSDYANTKPDKMGLKYLIQCVIGVYLLSGVKIRKCYNNLELSHLRVKGQKF